MTSMVRLLERDRLVERRRDPADGRASLIVLTPRVRSFRSIAERALSELERPSWLLLSQGEQREFVPGAPSRLGRAGRESGCPIPATSRAAHNLLRCPGVRLSSHALAETFADPHTVPLLP